MKVKSFAENLTLQDEEEVRLLAFDEGAVYGIELALPESDADPYRVDLTRVSRESSGLERSQRLTLQEYPSHTEAEEAWREVSATLFEDGREAIAEHLPALAEQPADNPQFIVATYPPHAPFTGGEVSVSLLALTETGLAEARLGVDLAQATASDLNKQLDAAIEEGGPAALLETATHFAREQSQLAADAPLFPPQATALLDRGAELAQHLAQPAWEVELNEHVSHLSPYVSAEYRVPSDQVGEVNAPVRLHLEGDTHYGFAVSAPDDAGAVSLAAIKTFDSEILGQEVTASTILKTYTPEAAELDPRTAALSDARALIYEWGRDDLDHAMGTALLLAKEQGFAGEELFQQGPPDPFDIPADARRLETIQAEREWERDAELFGKAGDRNPQPADLTQTHEMEGYEVDPAIAGVAEESDLPSRLATPIGAYVDRHAGDYLLTDAAILPPAQRLAPPDEIEYQVLPLDSLPLEKEKPSVPAEYDPVRMKPITDDIPADHGADYAFEVRHIRAFDSGGELTDSYHVVEAVKSWHDPAILDEPDERLTLSLPLAAFDDKASAFETAEQLTAKWWAEGLQPAMQDATNLAANHLHPNIMDVENGHLFGMGPPDPFTVEFGAQERQTELSDQDAIFSPPALNTANYSRTINSAAYDVPLEEGQTYAFQSRRIEALESHVAPHGMDALAVEAVKSWQEVGQSQQEIVTLGIYYDRDEAQTEVDTYVDLAEGEGIQASMSRAAVLADAHAYHGLVAQADELGLHINEGVSYGNMFQQGPPDPFLSEREITLAAQAYAAEHPPNHKLGLEVLSVEDKSGQVLGHSVVAIDAVFRPGEDTHDLGQAQSAIGYELAHFEDQASAEDYKASLSAYMDKRDFAQTGTDISPTLDFVRTLGQSNGHAEHWLSPWDIADLSKGEWNLQHQPENFKPFTIENTHLSHSTGVTVPDIDI